MGLTITSKLIRSSASSHTAELEDQAFVRSCTTRSAVVARDASFLAVRDA
jgi:hypothetical protein